jgi:hypothetical protein
MGVSKILNSMIDIKLIKKSIIPIVVFISFGFSSFGQNALSAAGGHFKTNGGSTSFTVGQVAYILKKGTGSYLNEGVQQVYTKKTTPIEELVYLKEVQLYPNPTQETMTLILSSKEDVQVRYTIMDYLGKEIRNGNILSEKSEISLRDLPAGNYFISLKSKKENRIFKIVKI